MVPVGRDFESRGRGREPVSVSHKGRLKQARDRHQTWVPRRFQHWPPDLDHRFGTRDTLPTSSVRGAWKEEPQASPAPVPHSQAPQSPPFPAPVQAPPPIPHWRKVQATLIGQEGEDVWQRTCPRAPIGLGRQSPRSGSLGVPERCRCLPLVHPSGTGSSLRHPVPPLSSVARPSLFLRPGPHSPNKRDTRRLRCEAFFLFSSLSATAQPLSPTLGSPIGSQTFRETAEANGIEK